MCRPERLLAVVALGMAGILLAACSAALSRETAERAIREHFEARRFRITELDIGGISPVPLNRMTYMGTPGNVVEVRRITLEVLKDTGEYRKGQTLTFTDAAITLREKADRKGEWTVADISGIPVP